MNRVTQISSKFLGQKSAQSFNTCKQTSSSYDAELDTEKEEEEHQLSKITEKLVKMLPRRWQLPGRYCRSYYKGKRAGQFLS